jgi:hypothetical protein
MKWKFYLRKGSQKSTIQFEFRNGKNSRFRPSTNFVINSNNDWDLKKQRMKLLSSTSNANLINSKLSEFENLLNDLLYKENEKYILQKKLQSIGNKLVEYDGEPLP